MRPLDRQYAMMIGDNSDIAVQSLDSTAENYNPEFLAYLNAWRGLSKTYYTIAEVKQFTRLPESASVSMSDYNITSLDELRYFNGLTTMPFRGGGKAVVSVIYPDSITIVGQQTWILHPNLIYFEIGNAVTEIQRYLFQTNTAPTTYVCRTPTPPAYDSVGYSTAQRAICDLFVPAESIALYQQASVWNEFKSINAIDPSKKKQSL